MNKFVYIIGLSLATIVLIVIIVIIFDRKMLVSDDPENDPNYFLRKELQNFYPNSSKTFAESFWTPSIEKRGLTYFFDVIKDVPNIRCTSVKKAEEIYAVVLGEYLERLNSIPHIRPYLASFPISLNTCSLLVAFVDESGKCFPPPHIATVSYNCFKELVFTEFHPTNTKCYHEIFKKPGKESKFLEPFRNPGVPRSPPPSKEIKIPIFKNAYKDPPHWKSMGFFMSKFAEQYHLFPLCLIPVGKTYGDGVSFGFGVWGKEQMAIEQAHLMAAKCARDFLDFIRADKECIKFMKWRSHDKCFDDPATVPEPRHFAFRISLWDEGINRQPSPYIAEILYDQGNFKYFTSDEGQRLVLVHEETFDDAMKYLNTVDKKNSYDYYPSSENKGLINE